MEKHQPKHLSIEKTSTEKTSRDIFSKILLGTLFSIEKASSETFFSIEKTPSDNFSR